MTLLFALACVYPGGGDDLLERVLRAQPPVFRGALRVERIGKRVESRRVRLGSVIVRKGDLLAAELHGEGTLRLWLAGSKAVRIQGRSRLARVTDLSRKDRFDPLDLWRRGVSSKFEVREPAAADLPDAVSGPDGKPLAPARLVAEPEQSLVIAGAGASAPLVRVLVPRDRALARRIREIRLEIDPATLRLARILVDGPYAREIYSLSRIEEVSAADAGDLTVDLSTYSVEER